MFFQCRRKALYEEYGHEAGIFFERDHICPFFKLKTKSSLCFISLFFNLLRIKLKMKPFQYFIYNIYIK